MAQWSLDVLDTKHPTVVFIFVSQPDRRMHMKVRFLHPCHCKHLSGSSPGPV